MAACRRRKSSTLPGPADISVSNLRQAARWAGLAIGEGAGLRPADDFRCVDSSGRAFAIRQANIALDQIDGVWRCGYRHAQCNSETASQSCRRRLSISTASCRHPVPRQVTGAARRSAPQSSKPSTRDHARNSGLHLWRAEGSTGQTGGHLDQRKAASLAGTPPGGRLVAGARCHARCGSDTCRPSPPI